MTEYTRVTVQGEGRKADLVLPDDEPVAAMLPDVLSLLDDGQARSARPVALVTTVGDQLDPSLTLAEQAVAHGTLLRVVRVDQAPPPPEVADVTDVAADAVQSRSDAWRPVWGVVAGAVLAGVLGFLAAGLAVRDLDVRAATLLGVCAALAVVAALLARRDRTEPAVVAVAAAVGAAVVAARELTSGAPGETALVAFGLVGLLVAVVAAAGSRDTGLTLGGATAAALVGAVVGMHALDAEPTHTAAVVAVLGCLLVGLLPGIAMSVSGLNGLDDRVVEGRRVSRAEAHRAVGTTHRALTWSTVAAAVVTGACAWVLAGGEDPWSRLLAVAVAGVLLLRTRVFPLAPQRLALLAAGATPLVALLAELGRTDPARALAVAGVVLVVLALLVGARPREHVVARARRLGNVVELVAVVALVPLVLAHLGVFADLVETF
ncbi:type VII secretion integral membrane protein EccD [Cellulomonas sp. NS3]|uniref:type VII secretion integral membrane protein EccD n=1 Tax=Cellulomonas sp. NS3 TaxID=2973977 RepID=UPI002163E930|nr:type VII secretion integral membrane protein EccD [Cellulomonas sp. NS3]